MNKEEKEKIKRWKKAIEESDRTVNDLGEDINNSMTWRMARRR